MDKILLKNAIEKPQSGEWGKEDDTGNGIPVIRTTNFTNTGEVNYSNVVTRLIDQKKFEKKVLQNGDIIIEKSGGSEKQPVGRVIYFDGESDKFLFNNFTSALRVKNDVNLNSKYLFYYLFSFYKKGGTLKFQNKTTGLHNLKLDHYINGVTVPIVDVNEQERIVNVLDNLYKSIKLRKEKLEHYDYFIKSRFVELFGDPIENNKNFESIAGENVFKLSNGKTIPQNERKECGIPAYGGNGISWYTDNVLFEQDTIVVGRVGFQSGNVNLAKGPLWVTDNAMYISQILDENYELEFLYALMEHIDFTRYQDAGDLKKVTQKPFMQMKYIKPPISLQKEYMLFVHHVDKLKVEVQKSLDETQLLFDSLMQRYFD